VTPECNHILFYNSNSRRSALRPRGRAGGKTTRTLAGHAVGAEVVAQGAGTAARVLRGGETELGTSPVVGLARVPA
jgi:hypothetical protein